MGSNHAITTPQQGRCMAVVGVFDGVHRGHQYLLSQLDNLSARRGLAPLVVTFNPHPAAVLAPPGPPLLLSRDDTLALLGQGPRQVHELPFTPELQRLTARQFMRLLHQKYHVAALLLGWDTQMGCDQPLTPAQYDAQGQEEGVEVLHAPRHTTASSRAIRHALADGHVRQAADMLGHPYTLRGTVIDGRHLGRTLGFPTANLGLDDPSLMLPLNGVYATDTYIQDQWLPSVTNIGHRPTVDGSKGPLSIETHIIGWNGDLYGQPLEIRLQQRLRPEQHFDSLDALKAQIAVDIDQALNTEPWRN